MHKILLLTSLLLLNFTACTEKKVPKGTKSSATMSKCGAGKCGANMFDEGTALEKKKKNLLSQMGEGDKRRDCVRKAKSTKDAYNCVRNPQTKKLSLKCGIDNPEMKTMKCGAGKCGSK